ncbi:heme o synthase [Terriglobus albidus]|uniref:heme o synthase n=1 Tax=Terriglobus albidus TaxID=1592106 RepID=UPI00295B8BD6|nr:heme o synthase [Terriglobus albidus]
MQSPATTHDLTGSAAASRLREWMMDYAELFKARVTLLVVITGAAGFYLGSLRSGISPFNMGLLKTLGGMAVVTAGSAALNEALERRSDAQMRRTARRPMASGRIGLLHGLLLGFAAVFLGSMFLAHETNLLTGTLTLITAVGYVGIYTPLKRMTTLATFIGAFPGALPPLIGWTAARGMIEWPGVALFAVLFVWQFPHFMAIAWMYREDYASAGIKMTPVVSPNGVTTVAQSLFYAVLMIPVSLWTTWLGVTGIPYAIAATVLSLGYLWYTVRFARILKETDPLKSRAYARDLLKASVIYLPLLLAAMMLNAQGRIFF